ncbi:MAG: DEAD/DEAH box helicase [Bacteroidetes bacterium]|nr:MAG: DEAD/DEAH box helicase [Bacteroidota bacterium]
MKRLKFEELNLSGEMLRAVVDMGFEETTHIQSETIPTLMEGKDIIGQAQTGTGKTAAYAIPIIENIENGANHIQAVVMCPTRELVIQVSDEFQKLMKYKSNISVVPIYGGQEIGRQLKALKKNPHIVIGTPGRTIDHIKRGTMKLDNVSFVVLDEADEMLDMGFKDDIELILAKTPKTRQTIMFSATMPEDITRIMKRHQNHPKQIDVTLKKIDTPKIEQFYFELHEKTKPEALARLLDLHNIKLALVFCNTRKKVDTLVEILKSRGYFAEGLHGEVNQNQRERIMSNFRNGSTEILVATDVAARGIDVNDVEAVFNYDLPGDDEDYIHRIGRTGRAGKSGIAFTFVVGKEIYYLRRIERANEIKVKRSMIPTIDDLDESRLESIKNIISETIDKGHLSKFINYIESLVDGDFVTMDIAAALLKITLDGKNESFDNSMNFHDYSFQETPKEDFNRRKGKSGSRRNGKFRSGNNDKSYSNTPNYRNDKKIRGKHKRKENKPWKRKKK